MSAAQSWFGGAAALLHLAGEYGHLEVSERRRLRQLKEVNGRLKCLVADLTLDKHILTETLQEDR